MIVWGDGVVPLAVELGTFEVDGGHVCIRYDNAARVLAGVEFTAHSEAGFGGSGRNQLDDHPIADERLGAPVLADKGKEAVLDLVPLAGAGRQVADHDVEAEFVSQLLQLAFPQTHPRAVAAPAIGGDQQSGRLWSARPTDGAPPLADAIDGERGRVVINADTHPTGIGGEVVDPVGHRAAELLDQEVMHTDFLRVALGAIFAPVVAEIADQLVSRPAGFPPQPLAERGMRLSPHTAPIRQTRRSFRCANVRRDRRGSGPASQESGRPEPYAPESA